MGIFMVQGALIGVLGTLLGTGGRGLPGANLETLVPAIESAVRRTLPGPGCLLHQRSALQAAWVDVADHRLAFVLSLLATLYPAWRASRTQPAEALRYE
jgi:lipoprotein-releasing system permease protein